MGRLAGNVGPRRPLLEPCAGDNRSFGGESCYERIVNAVPDMRIRIRSVHWYEESTTVIGEQTESGTNTGAFVSPMGTLAPTGTPFWMPNVLVMKLGDDGRATEVREHFDVLNVMRQLVRSEGTTAPGPARTGSIRAECAAVVAVAAPNLLGCRGHGGQGRRRDRVRTVRLHSPTRSNSCCANLFSDDPAEAHARRSANESAAGTGPS